MCHDLKHNVPLFFRSKTTQCKNDWIPKINLIEFKFFFLSCKDAFYHKQSPKKIFFALHYGPPSNNNVGKYKKNCSVKLMVHTIEILKLFLEHELLYSLTLCIVYNMKNSKFDVYTWYLFCLCEKDRL